MSDPGGELFDEVADAYERFRPGYPPAIVDEACAIGGLQAGSRVLEIGCGTGQLTAALAGGTYRARAFATLVTARAVS